MQQRKEKHIAFINSVHVNNSNTVHESALVIKNNNTYNKITSMWSVSKWIISLNQMESLISEFFYQWRSEKYDQVKNGLLRQGILVTYEHLTLNTEPHNVEISRKN